MNPIMDTKSAGGLLKSLRNVEASRARIGFIFPRKMGGYDEREYADYGPFRQIYSAHEQSHQAARAINHESA